jgi:hypothetical protein
VYGTGATAGAGGSAVGTATAIAYGDSAVNANLYEVGGAGGSVLSGNVSGYGSFSQGNGNAGNGGAASATVTGSNNAAASVSVLASATGGQGGQAGGSGSNGGGGSATAIATGFGGGSVDVTANATGGGGFGAFQPGGGTASATATGQIAQADATGIGGSGTATAIANASGGIIESIHATATAPTSGTSAVESRATVGNGAPSSSLAADFQSASYATGLPLYTDANTVLTGNPAVASKLNVAGESIFGLIVEHAGYSATSTGSITYSGSQAFTINTSAFVGSPLTVGLIDPSSTGDGFDKLTFSIFENGSPVLSDTFNTLGAANTFFTDDPISLGLIAGDTTTLDFTYDLIASVPGDSYQSIVIIGVPEPSTVALILWAAVAIPFCFRGRRWHRLLAPAGVTDTRPSGKAAVGPWTNPSPPLPAENRPRWRSSKSCSAGQISGTV